MQEYRWASLRSAKILVKLMGFHYTMGALLFSAGIFVCVYVCVCVCTRKHHVTGNFFVIHTTLVGSFQLQGTFRGKQKKL